MIAPLTVSLSFTPSEENSSSGRNTHFPIVIKNNYLELVQQKGKLGGKSESCGWSRNTAANLWNRNCLMQGRWVQYFISIISIHNKYSEYLFCLIFYVIRLMKFEKLIKLVGFFFWTTIITIVLNFFSTTEENSLVMIATWEAYW